MNAEFKVLIDDGEKMIHLKEDDPRSEKYKKWYLSCRSLIIDYFGAKSPELRDFALAEGVLRRIKLLKSIANKVED